VRGHALTGDDRVRAYAIERLMCDFALSSADLVTRFGAAARPVLARAAAIAQGDAAELLATTGTGFEVTETGRPFVRSICAELDGYFGRQNASHSPAV
jgi:oxygen-independent coproporphyrinogen-3 oxidase